MRGPLTSALLARAPQGLAGAGTLPSLLLMPPSCSNASGSSMQAGECVASGDQPQRLLAHAHAASGRPRSDAAWGRHHQWRGLHQAHQQEQQQQQQEQQQQQQEQHEQGNQQGQQQGWKHRLLATALPLVKEHGWSNAALEQAARQMGLSPAVTGLLPRCAGWVRGAMPRLCASSHTQGGSKLKACAQGGGRQQRAPDAPCTRRREGELVEHFIVRCNQELLAEMTALRASGRLEALGGTRARLAHALKLRLQMLEPVMDTWPQVGGSLVSWAAAELASSGTVHGSVHCDAG